VAQIRAETRTTLAGNPEGGCPVLTDQLARAFQATEIPAQLARMTDPNMVTVIDRVLPKVRAALPGMDNSTVVNAMTDAYCQVLAGDDLAPAARAERLGNFSMLVYGQLKHPSHGG
jgi:hypothetical protein